MTAQPGSPNSPNVLPSGRQRQRQRRQEARRLRQDLVRAVGLSLMIHGGLLWWAQADRWEIEPPTPRLIEFRLISPPDDPAPLALDSPDLTSIVDAQAAGQADPEEIDLSAGGSETTPLAPPQPEPDRLPQAAAVESSDPTDPREPRVVRSAPVATLQRQPQLTAPAPPDPISDLHQQLEQAVQDRQWQRAATVAEQMALALPQRSGELLAYQDRLYQLASYERDSLQPQQTPVPDPSPQIPSPLPTQAPLPNFTPSPPPSPPPTPDPEPVSLTPPIAAAPVPPAPQVPPAPASGEQAIVDQPSTAAPLSEPSVGSGSGGQISGIANSQQASEAPTQLATLADPTWSDYLARLQIKVQQQWSVRQAQDSYSTVVVFTLSQQGQLQDIQLQNPSQDPLVDAAVMSAIRQAAPFDPLPASFTGDRFTFQLDVLSGSREVVVRSP